MSQTYTIGSIRRKLRQDLKGADLEDVRLEADLIIEHVTGLSRAEQIMAANEMVGLDQQAHFDEILGRRIAREPLDNIFGYREFYGLKFKVNPDVLSPRPETEMLVDYVLEMTEIDQKCRILDIGTGSGAIPIAIGQYRENCKFIAADISLQALKIARYNVKKHNLENQIACIQSDWFSDISGKFDFIISNPPYINTSALPQLSLEVQKFDPVLALDGGVDGLDPYRIIAEAAKRHLKPNSQVVLEIGYDQGLSVFQIMEQAGFSKVELAKDLSGHDRRIIATY